MPKLPVHSHGSQTFLDPNPGENIDDSLDTYAHISTYTQRVPVTAEGTQAF